MSFSYHPTSRVIVVLIQSQNLNLEKERTYGNFSKKYLGGSLIAKITHFNYHAKNAIQFVREDVMR